MRVALARLRVWVELGGAGHLDEDLRWLRRRLAKVRDLDVQLQREPPPGWEASLRRQRGRAQEKLVEALEDPRVGSLLDEIARAPGVPEPRAKRAIPRLAQRALRRAHAAKRHGYDVAALHRLRGMVRRLRFALEWTGQDAGELEEVQDAIGAVCDLTVALRGLEGRHGDGLRRYREQLERKLRRAERQARAATRRVQPRLEALRDKPINPGRP